MLPRVEPDLIGEQLIADSIVRQGLLATVIEKVTSAGQRSRLLEVLLRMCASPIGSVGQTARSALTSVLDDHLDELLAQAIEVTADGDTDVGSDAWSLTSRLGSGVELAGTPAIAAQAIESVTFPERASVQALAASVYVTAARDAEARQDYAAASDLETKAATARTRAGQLEAAQASIDRAMVYLSTAPSFSARKGEPLARVLSAGSLVSTGLSRPGVALRDALRGVQIVEELIAQEPGTHASQLLEARLSLVIAYMVASQIDEALATARRAIADSPTDSGQARTNIRVLEAQILQGRGELDAALELLAAGMAEIQVSATGPRGAEWWPCRCSGRSCSAPSVASRRPARPLRRPRTSPWNAARPESVYVLAQTKIGAATVVALTDAALALAMVREASALLRNLYEQIPDGYGPNYVLAETLHAKILDAIDDTAEARKVATRAARLVREGFAARPVLYLGSLFMSAQTLAEIHVGEDNFEEAIKILTDAHALMSRLDSSVAPLAEGSCALLLRCVADVEMAREDYDAAAQAARRALEAYNALIAVHLAPDYLLARVGTRLLLLEVLGNADRHDEFMAEAADALTDAQFLLERMPNDPSRRILALTRVLVAQGYGGQGNVAESISLLRTALEEFRLDYETTGVTDSRFWYSQATLLLGPLLHAAALSRQTMEGVSRWTRTQAKAEVHARLLASPYREAVSTFQTFSEMYWSTRDGAYATLRDVLRAYESSTVRGNSRSDFSPEEFFDGKPNTLYLCAPPDEQEQLAPIFTALVRSILTHAYRYQGDNLNLLLLLDEAGNIARISNLDTIATTAAGTRMQLVTVFHDLSQLEALYGPARASSIADNHSALLFLPGSRDEATMHLADRLLRDESGPARFTANRSIRQLKPASPSACTST